MNLIEIRSMLKKNNIGVMLESESHTYTKEGKLFESVTSLIKKITGHDHYSDLINDPKIAERIEAKKRIVDEVHKNIQTYYKTGNLAEVENKKGQYYMNNFKNFEDSSWRKSDVEIVSSEQILVSEKLKTAGTIDLVLLKNGRISLLDIKSSSRTNEQHVFKMFLYGTMLKEILNLEEMPDCYILYLSLMSTDRKKRSYSLMQVDYEETLVKDFVENFSNYFSSRKS